MLEDMIKRLTLKQILEKASMIDNWVRCNSTFSIHYIGKTPNRIEIVIDETSDEGDNESDYSIIAQIGSCVLGEYLNNRSIRTLFKRVERMHNESSGKYLSAYLSEEQA